MSSFENESQRNKSISDLGNTISRSAKATSSAKIDETYGLGENST